MLVYLQKLKTFKDIVLKYQIMSVKEYKCHEDCSFCSFKKQIFIKHMLNIHGNPDPDINNYTNIIDLQISETERMCSSCYKIKENNLFNKDKNDKNYLNKCIKCSESNKKFREKPEVKERMKVHRKNYEIRYPEEIRNRKNEWAIQRRNNNPGIKLIQNMRSRMYKALSKNYAPKSDNTQELLGCSLEEWQDWLEYNFDEKMSWDNYGSYWQVDHVKPCISFDLKTIGEQEKCFHWTNTRPLEKTANNIKK